MFVAYKIKITTTIYVFVVYQNMIKIILCSAKNFKDRKLKKFHFKNQRILFHSALSNMIIINSTTWNKGIFRISQTKIPNEMLQNNSKQFGFSIFEYVGVQIKNAQ